MKKIKTYEGFFSHKSDLDKDIDKQINDIFEEVKATFDPKKLAVGDCCVSYNLNGTIIYIIDDTPSFDPIGAFIRTYELKIDNKEVMCSNSLKRKIFNFLFKKYDELYKEKQLQDLTSENRMGKKYNL